MLSKPKGSTAAHSFVPKKSTNIAKVEWHSERSELHVTFKNGASHAFHDVPLGVFNDMKKAPSPGSFFFHNIKGRFTGRSLGT